MKATEVAQSLGVSEKTVLTWGRLGVIPCKRNGKKISFDEADYAQWLASPAGQNMQAFLDTGHRSDLSEEELLAWAEEELAALDENQE